jgi:SAM-dependent methyltransferase
MTNFDAYAQSYEEIGTRALALSGEGQEYFARGRIAFLKRCIEDLPIRIRSVLDFGCGIGSSISLLRQAFAAQRVVGVDVSVECLEVAQQRNAASAEFYSMDQFSRRDDVVDLVFCNGVFHHIDPPARAAAIQLVARSLRPGAIFALWENNPWNPGARYSMARCDFDRDAIAVSPREAVRLVQVAGLRVLSVRFLFIFPRILKALRWSEWHLSWFPLGAQYQVLSEKPLIRRTLS